MSDETAGLRNLAFKTSLFFSVLRGELKMKPELWERFEEIHNELAAASHERQPAAPTPPMEHPLLTRLEVLASSMDGALARELSEALEGLPALVQGAVKAERERLGKLVGEWAVNKMHRPWLRELAKLFDP